jgi:hypothetical protein
MSGTVVRGRGALRTIVAAVVPAAARLDDQGWRQVEDIIEGSLSARPPRLRRQLALFLRFLAVVACLRWGRRLGALDPAHLRRLLAGLERSRLVLLRRGVWGLRTLAFMGYYGRSATVRELGYRAEASGWTARGAGEGAWEAREGAAPPEADVIRLLEETSDDA